MMEVVVVGENGREDDEGEAAACLDPIWDL
jgi:hypothetical protein